MSVATTPVVVLDAVVPFINDCRKVLSVSYELHNESINMPDLPQCLRPVHAGNQLMMSNDEEDLEQLIKGGPFELGLYADKLGSHIFGIDSVAQVRTPLSST